MGELLTKVAERFFPAGEVVLERVPPNLRGQLYTVSDDELYKKVQTINSELRQPLTDGELDDLEQARWLIKIRGSSSIRRQGYRWHSN